MTRAVAQARSRYVAAATSGNEPREAELAAAWEQRRYPADSLVDDLGRRLQVVFPGRRWGGPGPDFQGAVLALPDGTLLRGDVEVHRRSSGWLQHGHTHDPAYDHVVLHVVHRVDAPTLDHAGRPIPTVVLPSTNVLPLPLPVVAPCLRCEPGAAHAVLTAAGRERFAQHVARFAGDLAAVGADQTLWRGLAEGLGYTHNRVPFGRLADVVPWTHAAQVVATQGQTALAARLLGAAGLADEMSAAEWATWEQQAAPRALSRDDWALAAVRPANHPARRCRGLAHLAATWMAAPATRWAPAAALLDAVRVEASAPRPRLWPLLAAEPWIGRGRAQVVAINVLLPLSAAAGIDAAAALYERLPGEPPNRVYRYMAAQLGLDGPAARPRTACLQQGLLHLFKAQCASRVCERCPAAAAALDADARSKRPPNRVVPFTA